MGASKLHQVATAISDPPGYHRTARRRTRAYFGRYRTFPMTLTGFCKHARVLEKAGIVRPNTRELPAEPLRDVARWVLKYEQFWNSCLDRLESFFANHKRIGMKLIDITVSRTIPASASRFSICGWI
jgi:hypothetical protein